MKPFRIEVKGVGIITEATPKAQLDAMIKMAPGLQKVLDKLKEDGKEESSKPVK